MDSNKKSDSVMNGRAEAYWRIEDDTGVIHKGSEDNCLQTFHALAPMVRAGIALPKGAIRLINSSGLIVGSALNIEAKMPPPVPVSFKKIALPRPTDVSWKTLDDL